MHALEIILCVAPITIIFEVAEIERILELRMGSMSVLSQVTLLAKGRHEACACSFQPCVKI
nr:hypothetical protein CIT39_05170 [Bradyrhizobium symbiodeficiens]